MAMTFLALAVICFSHHSHVRRHDEEPARLSIPPIAAPNGDVLIENGMIFDGSGKSSEIGSLLISRGRIVWKGVKYRGLREALTVIDATGLALAPGFIDSHSHTDSRVGKDPTSPTQLYQGITTAVVGQDGGLPVSYRSWMSAISQAKPVLNFAAFAGHNSIRDKVMGSDYKRRATPAEIEKMKERVDEDMKDGALGLSTGLEYNPGFYSDTAEVVALAKVAAKYKGSYISHMRSEDREILPAIEEVLTIGREAKLPVQISHFKLALPMIWKTAPEILKRLEKAQREGIRVSADIYPYTYWQSTITVLTSSRDWDREETWRKAIEETGGADKILLSRYSHRADWEGQTIELIAAREKRSAAAIVLEIVQKTQGIGGVGGSGSESVIVTAMDESDVSALMKWGQTSICSDGSDGGSHPRGAGSFPRVIGYYAREKGVFGASEAIRRMTSLPADQFGFKDRGRIAVGKVADIVIFDLNVIRDTATPASPSQRAIGVRDVLVSGQIVLRDGSITGRRSGRILTRTLAPFRPTINNQTALLDREHAVLCCGG